MLRRSKFVLLMSDERHNGRSLNPGLCNDRCQLPWITVTATAGKFVLFFSV